MAKKRAKTAKIKQTRPEAELESEIEEHNRMIEPGPEETLQALDRGIENAKELIRILGETGQPVPNGVALRCLWALDRLKYFPVEVPENFSQKIFEENAYRDKREELAYLTNKLVDWLAKRKALDVTKLLAIDQSEWDIAQRDDPGSEFATATPNKAAFASANLCEQPKQRNSRPSRNRELVEFANQNRDRLTFGEIAAQWNISHPGEQHDADSVRKAVERAKNRTK